MHFLFDYFPPTLLPLIYLNISSNMSRAKHNLTTDNCPKTWY